jgi:hypothetical protein
MKDQASDLLAAVTLALFCGTMLYGGVIIRALF